MDRDNSQDAKSDRHRIVSSVVVVTNMIDNTVTAIDDIIGGAGGVGVGGEDAVPVAASIIHVHGE